MPTVNGRTYDLTPLINEDGFYFWEQAWNGTNYYWQLQLCEDIWNQNISSCVNPSPVNQITTNLKTCVSAGQTTVSAWDTVPSGNGIRLTYFHGDAVGNVSWRQSTIYIECDLTGNNFPTFEHMRSCEYSSGEDSGELGPAYHFYLATKYVC
jgi:hypothetical protein